MAVRELEKTTVRQLHNLISGVDKRSSTPENYLHKLASVLVDL